MIYKYLKEILNIETDYIFKRDYILTPLKRGTNQYNTERFDRDDLYHLYITLNIRLKDLSKMIGVTDKTIRNDLKYYDIKKSSKMASNNCKDTYNKLDDNVKQKINDKIIKSHTIDGKYFNNIDKRNKTNIIKYGSITHTRQHWSQTTKNILNDVKLLENYIIKNKIINGNHLAYTLGISQSTANVYIRKYNLGILFDIYSSTGEREVRDFVNQYYKTINNSRKIIPPYEIDIYIPELKLAIEYNGDYWHSFSNMIKKDKIKEKYCHTKGITLYIIKESEWKNNKTTIKDKLKTLLRV
jgi:very-short-patch-repair endonuclease